MEIIKSGVEPAISTDESEELYAALWFKQKRAA